MSDKKCSGCPSEGSCTVDPATCSMPVPTRGGFKHIIAVGSGKGGVGKSTVSALLAIGLSRLGHKTALLDADITGPSIPSMLGVSEMPHGTPEGIVPPVSPVLGIRIMSMNLFMEDTSKPVVWRGPLIGNVIGQFWNDTDWVDSEILVIDLPPGTSDAPLTVMQTIALDGVVMVTTPQDISTRIVEKMMHMTRMMNVPLVGMVENMSHAVCPHCGERWDLFGPSHMEEVRSRWDIPQLGSLPIDRQITLLADSGKLEEYRSENQPEEMATRVLSAAASLVTYPPDGSR
ncbi:MAG TPA: P-loop NTPase [Synergistales bacterium]|nr:P-loop NTPase [Synergistales bacterium]MDI9392427.1 P-loop NTPase [Synergistota bacterium]HRW88013.1 P-loop NTPase [Thermovirgaceae bacterium]MDD3133877.1 P-loop NTPase [Synergistales bacterium]MDD3830665.1 P-loop NTPase [Synergistales bacterium]